MRFSYRLYLIDLFRCMNNYTVRELLHLRNIEKKQRQPVLKKMYGEFRDREI